MAAKRKSTRTPTVQAAQSREEAEMLLADIGAAQREVTRIEADMNDELSSIKAKFEESAKPFNEAIKEKVLALQMWAEAHRAELLPKGKKTVELATGELQWRNPPPSVRITGADAVLEILRLKKLEQFIRTKEEINKEAILADREAIAGVKGISITQVEHFVAKPFEAEIEHVSTTRSN